MIKPDLKAGDIVLDGGNENYRNTERRQRECEEIGGVAVRDGKHEDLPFRLAL
jgi:6-phosphogluconate dehydrogenase